MKKRRKTRKNSIWGHQGVLVGLAIVAVGLLAAAWFSYKAYVALGEKLAYAKQWETADRQFSRRAMGVALKNYRSIAKTDAATTGIADPQSINELAELMIKLCGSLDSQDLGAVTECVDGLGTSPEILEFVPDDMSALDRQQRIDEVTKWAVEQSDRAANQLQNAANIDPPQTLDAARSVVSHYRPDAVAEAKATVSSWMPHADKLGADGRLLQRAVGDADRFEAFHRELTTLVENCDRAIQDLQERDLAAAMCQWESMQQAFPRLAAGQLWKDYSNQLRDGMRQKISGNNGSNNASLQLPAKRLSNGPPRPDMDRLVTLTDISKLEDPDLAFVHVHEYCFALDPSTGSAQWVIDVGYDARWLPQTVEHENTKLVVCTWKQNRQDVVSVLEATDARHVWSLAIPPSTQLAGPPVLFRSKLNLLLTSKELWTVGIEDGKPLSRLTFPETSSSPMAVREDGNGMLVIGDKLGVYLVELGAQPRISDVVFPPKTPNTLSSRGMWIPPFAVIFQNELTDTSKMLVYRLNDDRYEQSQSSVLPGRVWDGPAVVGADFLIVTDAGSEQIRHVDVEAPVDPVATRFERLTPSAYPVRPYFVSHDEAPFISMQGSSIACFWLDPLSNDQNRKPQVRWEHEYPDPQFVPIQRLQIKGDRVIVAAQSPERRSVLVRALNLASGDKEWSVELGGEITDLLTHDRHAMLRTDAGQLVHLRVNDDGGFDRRVLNVPPTDSRFDWIAKGGGVVRVAESPPRLQAVNYFGDIVAERSIASMPAGPVSVHVGELVFAENRQPNRPSKVNGVWCALVDTARRIQLIPLDQASQQKSVVYHQLSDEAPQDGWLRAKWLGNNAILASHPSGLLFRVDLQRNDQVLFLKRTDRLEEPLAPFSTDPVCTGGAIWVATTDATIRCLNRETLMTKASVKLPAPASTQLSVLDGRLLVGLRDGRVAVISDNDPPRLDQLHSISSRELRLSSVTSRGLLMVDDDGKVHLLDSNGMLNGAALNAPPTAVPPVEIGGRLFVATTSGAWRQLRYDQTQNKVSP